MDLKHPRFLMVRLSAYGDIIQSWPMVGLIRRQWPQAHITWLVEPAGAALLHTLPGLDEVLILPQKQWLAQLKRQPHKVFEVVAEMRRFQSGLAAARFDVALDPQGLWKSALWPWLAGVPNRVGFDSPRETVGWAYTHTMPRPNNEYGGPHASQQFASLIPRSPERPMPSIPEIVAHWPVPPVVPSAVETVNQWLGEKNAGEPWPLLILAPATTWASKHWPVGHWAELLRLLSRAGVRVVLVGAPGDRAYCDVIVAQAGGVWPAHWQNRVGQTDWATLQALLQQADGFVGPDSAPLHLACAVAANRSPNAAAALVVVGLYGPTVMARTGPFPLPTGQANEGHVALTHPMPCTGCHQRYCPYGHTACLTELLPETVWDVLNHWLAPKLVGP